jgi:hypothetical protein
MRTYVTGAPPRTPPRFRPHAIGRVRSPGTTRKLTPSSFRGWEPALADLLDDPIVRDLAASDGILVDDIRDALDRKGER